MRRAPQKNPEDPSTKFDRRIKKKRQRMRVHAKTVFTLKKTITKKASRLIQESP